MKIIHTSDWHIGREFEGESLAPSQTDFFSWLCDQIRTHEVDLVIVAGDIYDRAMPKGEAVTLLDNALNDLRAAGAEVLLISGNHDNAMRLNFGAQRQRASGVFIYANDEAYPEPFIYERNGDTVAIVAIPFLDPQRAQATLMSVNGETRPRTHQNVLEDAITVARERLGATTNPTICVAHAYVQGSQTSDSERHAVGNADLVSASIFTGFTYTALGHLHRPQVIPGYDTVAYSGSPLPYSFSEDHGKSVRLLSFDATGLVEVTTLKIPVGRPVVVLTDSFENLLTDEKYESYVNHWVSAKLVDEGVITEPMSRLRARFPFIASLAYAEARRGGASGPVEGATSFDELSPRTVITDYITDIQGREPHPYEAELTRLGVDLLNMEDGQ